MLGTYASSLSVNTTKCSDPPNKGKNNCVGIMSKKGPCRHSEPKSIENNHPKMVHSKRVINTIV